MQPAHFFPPASLSSFIAFYGIINAPEDFNKPYTSPPLGFCGFIFSFNNIINARLKDDVFMKGQYCATGQITSPMTGTIAGNEKIILVFIQPCGLFQLFGFNMARLTNTSLPLQELIGNAEADALIEKMISAPDDQGIIDVLNLFFLSRLPPLELSANVKRAIDHIHKQKGNVSVKEIEQACFITSRSLERYFNLYIGLSPKDYIKIFRFKCLMNFIQDNPGLTWVELCEKNGYYDHAHLSRYFTRFLNVRPSQLVHMDLEYINYLLQD